jgi:DNA polymerase I
MTDSPLANVQLHMVDDLDTLFAMKNWVGERRETPLCFDVESEGLDPFRHKVRLLQIGDMHQGWAVPFELWGGGALEVLSKYEGRIAGHNASFDHRMLKVNAGLDLPWHKLDDTMVLAALDEPGRVKGLKELSSRLIDRNAKSGEHALQEGMKKEGWTWATVPVGFAPYWIYAALDTVLTAHLWHRLHPRVMNSCPASYDLEMGALRVCSNMMLHGMKIDRPYVQEAIDTMRQFAKDAREWLKEAHGITSPLSAGQISRALEAVGYTITQFTPTGQPKVDKETLEGLKDGATGHVQQIAEYVLGVRHAEKVITSYLQNFLTMSDSNDMVHPSIWTLQAVTGRMSITDPALQTLHRDDKVVRGSFVPRHGYSFVSVDADQLEARIAANLSMDAGFIAAFREADSPGGSDFFSSVASQLFNEKIQKGDWRRQVTKNMVYCYLFGGGLEKMATTAGVSVEQMKPIRDQFMSRFKGLSSLSARTIHEAQEWQQQTGKPSIGTYMNKRIPLDPKRIYAGLNYKIQGTAAEIFKSGLLDLDAVGLGDYMILPVHDEILLEVPTGEAEEVRHLVEESLRIEGKWPVPITWGGDIMNDRWAKV